MNYIFKSQNMNKVSDEKRNEMPLSKLNFKLILIGFAIIVFGFILMLGSSNNDYNTFNKDIFSFRRITLAPIVIVAGFVFEIYAIMKKPKNTEKE